MLGKAVTKKLKYSIFFAASPLHLICLYELYQKTPDIKFTLILFLGKNDYANNQLYKTLKMLGFSEYISFQHGGNLIFQYFKGLILAAKLYKRFNSFDLTITMIDFNNSYIHSLRCFFKNATFVLIDDGFSTYVAYQRYLKRNVYLPVDNYIGIRGTIIRWLYFGTCYEKLKKKGIELFSIYLDDFESSKVKGNKNNFDSLKYFLGNVNSKLDSQDVFFIGTKQSERGAMTIEDELFYVDWLNKYWKLKGKTFFYVIKRSSSISKIELIKELKIPCLRFDMPLEIALMNNEYIPGIVCSTGSTLLKTLPMIYSSIEYYLVDVSSFYIRKADKGIFDFTKILSTKYQIKTLIIKR